MSVKTVDKQLREALTRRDHARKQIGLWLEQELQAELDIACLLDERLVEAQR